VSVITEAVSASLIHFLWQALFVGLMLWATLVALRRRSASARYAVSCAALFVLAALPVMTFALLYAPLAPADTFGNFRDGTRTAGAVGPVMLPIWMAVDAPRAAWLAQLQLWALPVWSIGVLILSVRLVGGCTYAFALGRKGEAADSSVLALVAGAARRMGVRRQVRVLISPFADSPSMLGWLRPVILLPPAAAMGITPEQLEAVLAHEIAHIKRHDCLVNVLQIVVETLLFYHPVVWWTSKQIRVERELCCDDLAVSSCGDALSYARALSALEKQRLTIPQFVVGSTGGPLLYRIQRLLGGTPREHKPSRWVAAIAVALAASCMALNVNWVWAHAQGTDRPEFEVASIKPNKSSSGMVQMGMTPGRFMATNVTLRMLLRQGYRLQDFQIVGGPSWFDSDRFDVVAKTDGSPADVLFGDQSGAPTRTQLMIRALLADRFKLVVHDESRELPIYALLPARADGRLGPQLTKSTVDCTAMMAGRGRGPGAPGEPDEPGKPATAGVARGFGGPPPPPPSGGRAADGQRGLTADGRPPCGMRIGPGSMSGGAVVMAQLATTLSIWVNRVVVDQTGLTGGYDVELTWTPDQMPGGPFGRGGAPPPGAPPLPPADPNGPSIFTAVQEQLGLKLDSRKGPVDVLVIDRAEHPTED
jgi:uncharacterized protein (TIGR03435 family)